MEHLSIPELQAFRAGTLPPALLLACDEHLAGCDTCRTALAEVLHVDRDIAALMDSLQESAAAHLTYEQTRLLAEGKLASQSAREHVAQCERCAAEVADLREFAGTIAGVPRSLPRSSGAQARTWVFGAIAAALLLAVLGMGVHHVVSGKSHEMAQGTGGPSVQTAAALPPEYQSLVAQTVASGKLPVPVSLTGKSGDEILLGSHAAPPTFRLTSPVNVVVMQDQPVFTWEAMAGALSYTVAIYDGAYSKVAESDALHGVTWQPKSALTRGALYSWSVTAHTAHGAVRSPVPPQAEAHFKVMGLAVAQELQGTQAKYPENHVLLAALFAREGDLAAAEDQLSAMAATHQNAALVQSLQSSLAQRYGLPSNTKPAQ